MDATIYNPLYNSNNLENDREIEIDDIEWKHDPEYPSIDYSD